MNYEICFSRRFSMSHRLFNIKNSRCYVPHGHNEYVKVHLSRPEGDRLDGSKNMMAPFASLKKVWHQWIDDHVDHTMQLSSQDPLLNYFREHEPENLKHIMITPGDPTTEVLAALFLSKINIILKDQGLGIHCHRIEIEETPTNTVAFSGNPDDVICTDQYENGDRRWWKRADMSINDLDL